jgi:limonene-1,2-epoxide hydrolase
MGIMTENYKKHLDAFTRGDIDEAFSYIHDDIVWYPNRSMRPVHGKKAMREFIDKWSREMSGMDYKQTLIIEHGNFLFVEGTEKYVRGGKPVETFYAGVVEWKDGKAIAWRDYFDLKTLEKQLAK